MTLTPAQLEQAKNFTRWGASLSVFCREVLGYADLLPIHDEFCQFIQDPTHHFKLGLLPRYSFKSSLGTIGYTLWRLVRDDALRVLIYSDATERAQAFLTEIKHHLLGQKPGSRFREVYGAWEVDPKQGVWNQSQIVVRPRQTAHAEPSVDTAGVESSKVGAHYDLIVFDDLVTKENVTTKDLMDKVSDCYRTALSLLKPGGEVVLWGTRWHFGDLYGRLVAENLVSKRYATFIRDAEVGEDGTPYPFAKIGLTKHFLAQQKAEQGSARFSCLYRNNPVDDETATFKAVDFRFYQPAQSDAFQSWLSTLYITAVLDAIPPPTSDHGDDAAIVVVGTDSEHTMFLLDAVAGRLTPDQQIDTLMAMHRTWTLRVVGLETNAFQRMIKSALERRVQESRSQRDFHPFSIVEFTGITQGNKEQRIQGLQPWHERGAIRFPGTTLHTLSGVWSQLAYQMLQFPHSPKDDLLDSLSYHLKLKQPGTPHEVKEEFPRTSAAWYEREWFKKQIRERARMPRWNRPPMPQLAFS